MVFWLLILPSAGFSLVSGRPHITSRCTVSPLVSMVAVSKLSVTARNVEMTDPLRAFADAKLSKPIERHDGMLAAVTLTLKVQHRGLHDTDHIGYDAHRAEVSATCTDGHIVRVCSETDDMYASIDESSDLLMRKLRKYKERKIDVKLERKAAGKAERERIATDIDDDDDDDEPTPLRVPTATAAPPQQPTPAPRPAPPLDWSLVRKKRFPMPPMTVEEAVLCLEYIDHDFYVFRDASTSEVSVIYRRNSGGVGLIQPEED